MVVGSRDIDRAHATASKVGAARGATYADASAGADVVILTVPWEAIEEVLPQLEDLKETVVIDVSYPYNKREREALEPSSTAEEFQKQLPNARVLKGWNHVHARHLTDPEVDGSPPRFSSRGTIRLRRTSCSNSPGTLGSIPSTSDH